jgi:hypothetical protein
MAPSVRFGSSTSELVYLLVSRGRRGLYEVSFEGSGNPHAHNSRFDLAYFAGTQSSESLRAPDNWTIGSNQLSIVTN